MSEPERLVPLADAGAPDGPMIPCRRCNEPTEIPSRLDRRTPWEKWLCRGCTATRELGRRQKRQHRASELLVAAGFMPEHAGARVSDFAAGLVADAGWPIGFGLVINGAFGRGKTHLAAAVAREAIVAGESVLFGMAREMLRRIRDTYHPTATETESAVVDALCRVGLLVIDDLGPDREGRATEHVLGTVHEVLSKRIGNHRPTIVTTNLPIAGIEQHYGGAIASRLSMLRTVTLMGPDRRRGFVDPPLARDAITKGS